MSRNGSKMLLIAIGGFLAIVVVAIGVYASIHGTTGYRSPRKHVKPVSQAPIIWNATTNDKLVALTFDDGPDPRFTPAVLDTLKKYDAKATFFLIGRHAQRYPELVKREMREGHLVGDHTWDHPHLTQIPVGRVENEVDQAGDTIATITGSYPIYMRPPYGQINRAVYNTIHRRGYRVVQWSTEFQELRHPGAEDDANYVASRIKPGDIVLGHDGRLSYHWRGVKMLPFLIQKLKAKGYRLVTVDELLKRTGMITDKGDLDVAAAPTSITTRAGSSPGSPAPREPGAARP
ncbi:MAG: polysaccharide deacetylase family protein [Chloroflexi bacterium]|nr:polysaccharide deacetylase family protein [Chloroflexota bacterium]